MKAIAIYSGKGGVGKTTVTALLGLALSKNHKVAILDVDINTPSMQVIFKEPAMDNLHVFSSGYSIKNPQFTGREVKKYLKGLAKEITDGDFDLVLLDMPPSVTDAHMVIGEAIPISSVVMVTQPNSLSISDLGKAHALVQKHGIPVAGVIENMVSKTFGESQDDYAKMPVLAHIPLSDDISARGNSGQLHSIKSNPLTKIAQDIYEVADRVSWVDVVAENKRDWQGEPLEDVRVKVESASMKESKKDALHFRGLESWAYIVNSVHDSDWGITHDEFLMHNDTNVIKRMLEAFNDEDTALFMVIRPPSVAISTFRGEIGFARLVLDKESYWGVPRVEYLTDAGTITMFPHEVSPVEQSYVSLCTDEGELVKVTGSAETRYLPSVDMMEMIDNQFGQKGDWRAEYESLGVIQKVNT